MCVYVYVYIDIDIDIRTKLERMRHEIIECGMTPSPIMNLPYTGPRMKSSNTKSWFLGGVQIKIEETSLQISIQKDIRFDCQDQLPRVFLIV